MKKDEKSLGILLPEDVKRNFGSKLERRGIKKKEFIIGCVHWFIKNPEKALTTIGLK